MKFTLAVMKIHIFKCGFSNSIQATFESKKITLVKSEEGFL